jgi:hypothetical protein
MSRSNFERRRVGRIAQAMQSVWEMDEGLGTTANSSTEVTKKGLQ